MKNIIIISLTLILTFSLSYAENNTTVQQTKEQISTPIVDNNDSTKSELSDTKDNKELNTTAIDEEQQVIPSTQEEEDYTIEDADESEDKNTSISEFEKLFVHHSAYIYYNKAIDAMFQADYKTAYDYAMKAKEIYDNTDINDSQLIALPYMPSYIRESGYTPKRIYYKMLKAKPYELKRAITKIKLISPPIASVVIKRTSTSIEVIIKNYGDLPLDEFELLLNDEKLVSYEKILPNEQKVFRLDAAPQLYELSFKEKYGFAPKSILLSEDE